MEPNNQNDILGTIRSNAVEAGSSTNNGGDSGSHGESNSNPTRRMITMYRSGFTIDNGPFRRLDDPNNSGFLRDLARGVTPSELFDNDGDDDINGSTTSSNGDMEVGLIDKRHLEYEDDTSRFESTSGLASSSSSSAAPTASFTGVGQSLGNATTTNDDETGIITPALCSSLPRSAPSPDESKPMTTIQIRLHNGKRLVVKCNLDDTIQTLVLHIEAATDSSTTSAYVLSSGYPPKILNDLKKTIEECGLKNAQVIQKLV